MNTIEIKKTKGEMIYTYKAENATIIDAVNKAVIERAYLRGVDLKNAKLFDSGLTSDDLERATSYGFRTYNPNRLKLHLKKVDLTGANFEGAYLRDADLEMSSLDGDYFKDADLRNANLFNADLDGANFYRADLRGANLEKGNFEKYDDFDGECDDYQIVYIQSRI